MNTPYLEALKAAVKYDPQSGTFTYMVRGKLFKNYIGKTAGQTYPIIFVMGGRFPGHKLAWFLHYGTWPKMIDHKNGDKFDNRIENLRVCTAAGNAQNARRNPGRYSRYRGVSKLKGAWIARIRSNGETKLLGFFKTSREAAKAYDAAAKERHGEFALLNFS